MVIVFLETCLENKTKTKFVNFCVSNFYIKTSHAFYSCQMKLLREEISVKKSTVKIYVIVLKRTLSSLYNSCWHSANTDVIANKKSKNHCIKMPTQGFIQAILVSVRQHKKLNLLIGFSNSIFIIFYFKAFWH